MLYLDSHHQGGHREFNPDPMIYTIDQTISSLHIKYTVPDSRVVFIASIAHTLVVERSCQFSVNTNAMTGSAADWVY